MAIVMKDPKENATTAMMMGAALVTGSVFILKLKFMSKASREGAEYQVGSNERVCGGARVRGRNRGQK